MEIKENIPLAPLTTLRVGGMARYFASAPNEEEIRSAVAWARKRNLPLFVLGGGSNVVVADSGFSGLVLHIALHGIEESNESGGKIFHVAAGEEWDRFVALAVEKNCGGIECLSGIPGSVGGTPIQNVGAYGQEVAQTIASVRAVEIETGEVREFSNRECRFRYRESIFNTSAAGRYIVLSVSFRLISGAQPRIEYADLKKFFANHSAAPTLAETRAAVREIRHSKAMLLVEGDPDCRSAGSFFKNPVVSETQYRELSSRDAANGKNIPSFASGEGLKISAAWLVEQSGFPRGYQLGNAGISGKHALAIINRGDASAAEIVALKEKIQATVAERFGIELKPEPAFVGFNSQPVTAGRKSGRARNA